MPTFNEAGFVKEFHQLKISSLDGGDIDASLTELVARVVASARAVAPVGWEMHVRSVRGKLKMSLEALSMAEPMLPDKLSDPMNHKQRVFLNEAIAKLTATEGPIA